MSCSRSKLLKIYSIKNYINSNDIYGRKITKEKAKYIYKIHKNTEHDEDQNCPICNIISCRYDSYLHYNLKYCYICQTMLYKQNRNNLPYH